MKNISELMKQAKDMQSKMAQVQNDLADLDIQGQAAAGLVTVTLSGKGDLKALKIDPSLAKSDEVEILEDLILAAHADARSNMDREVQEKMKALTGGLPLPPGFNF